MKLLKSFDDAKAETERHGVFNNRQSVYGIDETSWNDLVENGSIPRECGTATFRTGPQKTVYIKGSVHDWPHVVPECCFLDQDKSGEYHEDNS